MFLMLKSASQPTTRHSSAACHRCYSTVVDEIISFARQPDKVRAVCRLPLSHLILTCVKFEFKSSIVIKAQSIYLAEGLE